jgi:hypothetical protein
MAEFRLRAEDAEAARAPEGQRPDPGAAGGLAGT